MKNLISFLSLKWDQFVCSIHFLWIVPFVVCFLLLSLLNVTGVFGQFPKDVELSGEGMLDEFSQITSGYVEQDMEYNEIMSNYSGVFYSASYYDQELFIMKIRDFIDDYSDLEFMLQWRKGLDKYNNENFYTLFQWTEYPDYVFSLTFYPESKFCVLMIHKRSKNI